MEAVNRWHRKKIRKIMRFKRSLRTSGRSCENNTAFCIGFSLSSTLSSLFEQTYNLLYFHHGKKKLDLLKEQTKLNKRIYLILALTSLFFSLVQREQTRPLPPFVARILANLLAKTRNQKTSPTSFIHEPSSPPFPRTPSFQTFLFLVYHSPHL